MEQVEMPRYKCHKEVWALQIDRVVPTEDGGATLYFKRGGYGPIQMPFEWITRHDPRRGGYYVVYGDGYKSFSPADTFEAGYTELKRG